MQMPAAATLTRTCPTPAGGSASSRKDAWLGVRTTTAFIGRKLRPAPGAVNNRPSPTGRLMGARGSVPGLGQVLPHLDPGVALRGRVGEVAHHDVHVAVVVVV